MRNLVVLGFDQLYTADDVLNKLRVLQENGLVTLEDACVVERLSGGRVYIKQAADLFEGVSIGSEDRDATWGAFVGIPFFKPLAGLVVGAINGVGGGAPTGSLADYGIRDNIINRLGNTIPEGTSALFVLFNSESEDKILAEIRAYKPRAYGRVRTAA